MIPVARSAAVNAAPRCGRGVAIARYSSIIQAAYPERDTMSVLGLTARPGTYARTRVGHVLWTATGLAPATGSTTTALPRSPAARATRMAGRARARRMSTATTDLRRERRRVCGAGSRLVEATWGGPLSVGPGPSWPTRARLATARRSGGRWRDGPGRRAQRGCPARHSRGGARTVPGSSALQVAPGADVPNGAPVGRPEAGQARGRSRSEPIVSRRGGGTTTEPSGRWYVSRMAATTRARARPEPLSVCTSSGRAPGPGR